MDWIKRMLRSCRMLSLIKRYDRHPGPKSTDSENDTQSSLVSVQIKLIMIARRILKAHRSCSSQAISQHS